jgi:hypothetical protein
MGTSALAAALNAVLARCSAARRRDRSMIGKSMSDGG